MDYESQLRCMQQQQQQQMAPPLCNTSSATVVGYGAGEAVAGGGSSSIMALIRDQDHADTIGRTDHRGQRSSNDNEVQQQHLIAAPGSTNFASYFAAQTAVTAEPTYNHIQAAFLHASTHAPAYQTSDQTHAGPALFSLAEPLDHHRHHHHRHDAHAGVLSIRQQTHHHSAAQQQTGATAVDDKPDHLLLSAAVKLGGGGGGGGGGAHFATTRTPVASCGTTAAGGGTTSLFRMASPTSAAASSTHDATNAITAINRHHQNHQHHPPVSTLDFDVAAKDEMDPDKARIKAHPSYPRLVLAYTNCQKVGAPPEVVTLLDDIGRKYQSFQPAGTSVVGQDPELDQFMDAYCDMLHKYHDELTRPFKEAMSFFRKIELQLNALSKGNLKFSQPGDDKGDYGGGGGGAGGGGTSDEEDGSCGELDFHVDGEEAHHVAAHHEGMQMMQAVMIDPLAEEHKIKEQLMRRYSGYIGSLKQEFLKKKKKGKLPKEARQKLLDWWTQHYKWPYPSETEKASLAETTGLDQKQINNWFINQRKRHWKPSEDMQFVVMDSGGASEAQLQASSSASFIHSLQHEQGHMAHAHAQHHHHALHAHPLGSSILTAHHHGTMTFPKPDHSGPLPMDRN